MSPPSPRLIVNTALKTLAALLELDQDSLRRLWRGLRHRWRAGQHEGMYEVLEYAARLELCDRRGEKAVFYKRQRVRFLQDHIIAFQDQAWGDGEIFAEYRCAPGVAVDRYREGHRWHILISLREAKQRGDIEAFHIERTIKGGFTKPVEDFQTEVNHTTRRLTVSVVFPRTRSPKAVALIEQNAARCTDRYPGCRPPISGSARWR